MTLLGFPPPPNSTLFFKSNTCICCGAEGTTPVTAFKAHAGGHLQVVVPMCWLCAEEMERGNNPIYKFERVILLVPEHIIIAA